MWVIVHTTNDPEAPGGMVYGPFPSPQEAMVRLAEAYEAIPDDIRHEYDFDEDGTVMADRFGAEWRVQLMLSKDALLTDVKGG